MSTHDLPVPGSIAAKIDLRARLRVFDFDGTLAATSREAWAVLEPEIHDVSEAYWQHWLRCFDDGRVWAKHETQKMIEIGCDFLKNRFLDTAGLNWVESIERSVAAAYDADVTPMALLSMISASDRAALGVMVKRVPQDDPRLLAMLDTLMRLSALEGEITVDIYNSYREHQAQVARSTITAMPSRNSADRLSRATCA